MVDRERDDVDTRRVEVEGVARALAHELARHDHGGGRARGAVVGEASERAARRPEELRQVAVLDVVERHDRRHLHARGRNRQRIVDDVELRDLIADLLRAPRLERHHRDPQRAALGDRRILDLDRRETFCRILCAGGDEHGVLERPDPRQRPDELSRIGLGATEVAGGEREQGEADTHTLTLLTNPVTRLECRDAL